MKRYRRSPVTEVHFVLKGLTPEQWNAVFEVMSRHKLDFDEYLTALIIKACQALIELEKESR